MKRFTDNNDGTVTDNKTGLMWVKDGTSAECNNGKTLKWQEAIDFCKGLDFAGHKDWRLPTIQELQSIVDYGAYNPAIDKEYFHNTQCNYYWSSTTYAYVTGYAWSVHFYYGNVNDGSKTYSNYVRPVRGGQLIIW